MLGFEGIDVAATVRLQFLNQALIAAAEYLRQKLPHAGGILKKLGIVRIDRKAGNRFASGGGARARSDESVNPPSVHGRVQRPSPGGEPTRPGPLSSLTDPRRRTATDRPARRP